MTVHNVTTLYASSQQNCHRVLTPEADREAAASLARRMFEGHLKQYGSDMYGISQARSGMTSNPFFRTRRWLRKAKPEARKLYLVSLIAFVEALNRSDLDTSDAAIQQASHAETAAQGEADLLQLSLAADITPQTIRATIPALEADIAHSMKLRATLEKRLMVQG